MFKLRVDARTFFENIKKGRARGFKVDFDEYYFCLIAGLAVRQRDPSFEASNAPDLVNHFPDPYASEAEMLVALLLATEIRRLSVRQDDKVAIEGLVHELLDAKSPGRLLSNKGMEAMNSYASAGCDLLRNEWFDQKPTTLDYFLIRFNNQLQKNCAKR